MENSELEPRCPTCGKVCREKLVDDLLAQLWNLVRNWAVVQDLSQALEVSPATLYAWKNKTRTPDKNNQKKIRRFLEKGPKMKKNDLISKLRTLGNFHSTFMNWPHNLTGAQNWALRVQVELPKYLDMLESMEEALKSCMKIVDKIKNANGNFVESSMFGEPVQLHSPPGIEPDWVNQARQLGRDIVSYSEMLMQDKITIKTNPIALEERSPSINVRLNNSKVMGEFIVGSIVQDSLNRISQSTNLSDDLVSLMKELAEQVEHSSQNLPTEVFNQMKDDFEILSKEIIRNKPRWAFCKVSLEGLKEASAKVATIAPNLASIIMSLLPLIKKIA